MKASKATGKVMESAASKTAATSKSKRGLNVTYNQNESEKSANEEEVEDSSSEEVR